ncbi:MAG: aminotransferase class I/II-fold pyridoxal phosphate-dependent enzyme, partial [Nitrospinae bacterium]|nr:aminotransferase class I/II-fold pyridoxal phosphate-dependent enzyme [Nitrospinota bacterium]
GRIVVTNGSTELIHYLPRLWGKNRELALVCPCFSEYERAFTLSDVCIRKIFLHPENNFQPEIEPLLFQLTGWKNLGGVVIGHPNSPAGCLMSSDSLRTLLNYCEKRELFLVVDETFIEFCDPDRSMLRHMRQSRFLVLVRSFTKFFALPGLRLGYGVMHEAQAEKLQKCLPPWSVNSVAEAAGLAALDAGDFIESSREGVRMERIALHQNLESLEELEVFPSDANFILFRLKNGDESRADQLYTDLLSEGILMRNCGNFDGLNHSYFRVAVRSQTDNTRLIDALKRHLA